MMLSCYIIVTTSSSTSSVVRSILFLLEATSKLSANQKSPYSYTDQSAIIKYRYYNEIKLKYWPINEGKVVWVVIVDQKEKNMETTFRQCQISQVVRLQLELVFLTV